MDPTNDVVEVFHAADGWRWHRVDRANRKIVSDSGEAYTEHTRALEAAATLNPDIPLVDVDANKEH